MQTEMPAHPLVSWIKTPKTLLQQYLHRQPEADYRWRFDADPQHLDTIEQHLAELNDNGITLLSAYFQGEMLAKLKAAFEQALAQRSVDAGNPDAAISNNFMDLDPVFLKAATDDTLLEIISRYYGKRFAMGRADALRLEPTAPDRYGSFQWHHDSRGKQVKIQIMLTDVEAQGQRMTYLKQSHKRYYSYNRSRGTGSRFEVDYRNDPKARENVMDVTGPAGTVGLFDTNGLHSGNRNETARRDTITFYYPTPESHNFHPQRYRASDLAALDDTRRAVITFNPRHEVVEAAS